MVSIREICTPIYIKISDELLEQLINNGNVYIEQKDFIKLNFVQMI